MCVCLGDGIRDGKESYIQSSVKVQTKYTDFTVKFLMKANLQFF